MMNLQGVTVLARIGCGAVDKVSEKPSHSRREGKDMLWSRGQVATRDAVDECLLPSGIVVFLHFLLGPI